MNAIHSLFDFVGECLTIDTASRLNRFAVSEELQQQLDVWADANLNHSLAIAATARHLKQLGTTV